MASERVRQPQDAATIRHLRRGIGAIGMALPFILTIGNAVRVGRFTLLSSISSSYYTGMRDVLVGSLCAIGVFLVLYRYQGFDDRLSTLAGVLAVVVALFPTTPDGKKMNLTTGSTVVGRIHAISAAALFLLLAYFCLFLFTRSDQSKPALTPRKRTRNGIYYVCGAVILAAVGLAAVSMALPMSFYRTVKPMFWCETAAVLAFGTAWLVKGDTVFTDTASS
jgi:drug/metabolite transporter (DMT)-like permease